MINPVSLGLSGLMAASKTATNAAANVANAGTTGSLDAKAAYQPYQAVSTTNESAAGGGVQAITVPKTPAFSPIYDPDSPFANEDGMIGGPNVNLDEELVVMKRAEQAYKANAAVIRASTDMQDDLLNAVSRDV